MIIIANGYKLPQLDDDGATFFPALEFDIIRLASHNHDGVNSALISSTVQQLLGTDFVPTAGQPGTWEQLVTMPGILTFDACGMDFRLANGNIVYPSIEKVSANTYKLFTNNNALNYKVVYTS